MAALDYGRRSLLLAGRADAPPPLRPPYAREEAVQEHCSGCGACIAACPSGILLAAGGGYPEVFFAEAECTFCGACARACPEPVFEDPAAGGRAFAHVAAIGPACLAAAGVFCQSCADACPEAAIRFRPRRAAPPEPSIEADLCSGCGACVATCPVEAIRCAPPEAVDD